MEGRAAGGKGYNRYSTTPESNENSKRLQEWEIYMVKGLTQFHGDSGKITYIQAKSFLDEQIKHEGIEFAEEILESIFKNVEVDDEG